MMPSASNKPDNKGSPESTDPMKNVISVIEKKVRNLEKRKGKLDSYKQLRRDGDTLNKDQEEAVAKYDSVILNLEFARELQKQFISIQGEAEKLMRKQAKRERMEKQVVEIKRVQEILQLQNTLDSMGSEEVREHFLKGTAGALKLSQKDLDHLDELYKLISPSRDTAQPSYPEQLTLASEHIVNFLDAKEKDVAGTTYKELKGLVEKINDCGYFDKGENKAEVVEEEETEPTSNGDEDETSTPDNTDYLPDQDTALERQEQVQSNIMTHEPVSAVEDTISMGPAVTEAPRGHPAAPADYQQEDESFFTTEPFPRQRPFQVTRPVKEIVSSVQGTFNFLQESQIMNEVAASDPAVIVATSTNLAHPESHLVQQSTYKGSNLLSKEAGMSSSQSVTSDSLGGAADHSGASVPGMVSQSLDTYGSSSQDYYMPSQSGGNSGLSFMSNEMGGLEQGLGGASDVPPAIPMPNQSLAGGEAAQEQLAEVGRLNPNAKMFQSMYSGQGGQSGNGFSQSGAIGDDGFSQSHDYQGGFGSNGYGARSGGRGRGGPRGGNGGGRGMSNGYMRGGRNGNPNGGSYGGGRREGGFTNGNGGRGGSRGYPQGYPPYNRGSRGGPPRGQVRGRGGMSGGYSNGPRGSQSASQASA